MTKERPCTHCGGREWSNCLVAKDDDSAHGEGRCRFACIECGQKVQEGVCIRHIAIGIQFSMQTMEPVEVDEKIAALVGNIIVTYAQAERALFELLPPSCRGKRAWFAQDMKTLRKIMPRIDRSRTPWRDDEWYAEIKRLYDSVTTKRNAVAHGALLWGGKTSFVVGPQGQVEQNQDETLPMTMVLGGGPEARVKLAVAELEPILMDVKKLLRLIALR